MLEDVAFNLFSGGKKRWLIKGWKVFSLSLSGVVCAGKKECGRDVRVHSELLIGFLLRGRQRGNGVHQTSERNHRWVKWRWRPPHFTSFRIFRIEIDHLQSGGEGIDLEIIGSTGQIDVRQILNIRSPHQSCGRGVSYPSIADADTQRYFNI